VRHQQPYPGGKPLHHSPGCRECLPGKPHFCKDNDYFKLIRAQCGGRAVIGRSEVPVQIQSLWCFHVGFPSTNGNCGCRNDGRT
jgi:hypothetical protein